MRFDLQLPNPPDLFLTTMPSVLKLAVCLFDHVTTLDYQGPVELLGFLVKQAIPKEGLESPYGIEATYLAHSKDPVKPTSGPLLLADRAFDEVGIDEQFDIILIPGGSGARPHVVKPSLLNFVKRQVPGAKYVLSVCTGSWILAQAGALDGKRATTNKFCFKEIQAATSPSIEWVPKARWVVDGKIWTASGVTAGIDMANAFIEHLVGGEIAKVIRGIVELSVRQEGDDEFAAVHGLV